MFLFTTPAAPARSGSPETPVVEAVRQGARETGTSFEYLLSTAQRESALDPTAKAPTSSATGLFQFIEQTWLGLFKTEGNRLGMPDLASSVSTRSDGSHAVGDAATRHTILKLREDPQLASTMAGVLTQQNRAALVSVTGREPSGGELYMAHLLGARGAADLIRTASQNPSRRLASDMPEAAAANRSIFYDRQGRARGAGEVYALLAANQPVSAVTAAAIRRDAAPPTTVTGQIGPGLSGLFQNATRTGPVSDAVAKIWRVNNNVGATRVAGIGFFPRADGSASAPEDPASETPTATNDNLPGFAASVPLPPPRPATTLARPFDLQSNMQWRKP